MTNTPINLSEDEQAWTDANIEHDEIQLNQHLLNEVDEIEQAFMMTRGSVVRIIDEDGNTELV